ncbi:tetratricopeptide repeat-containing sensor histidine kinase [Peijinzhouia sedimentorum]
MNKLIQYLYFIALLLPSICFGQNLNIDSLKHLESQTTEPKDRIEILNNLALQTREIELQEAKLYAEEAEKLALAINDSLGLGRAKGNLGWINYRLGNWEESFKQSKEGFQISNKLGDLEEASRSLNNLGSIYYQQQNYLGAIQQFQQAYKISLTLEDTYTTIRSLNNIAFNYVKAGQLDSAMHYANKSIEFNEQNGSMYLTSFAQRVIGDVYLERGQIDEAIAEFREALGLSQEISFRSFEASILHRLGNALIQKGNDAEAIKTLKTAERVSKEHGYMDELVKSYKLLAIAYENQGNINRAFLAQKSYIQLNDSINNEAAKSRLAITQGMFESDRKETELKLLQAENELQQHEIEDKANLIAIGIFGIVIIGGLLLWLIAINRRTKIVNRQLEETTAIVNKQNQILEKRATELEEVNRVKNRIFSIVGHDLRAPVGHVKSALELLHSDILTKEEFSNYLGQMKREVDGVFVTLDNLLRWSKAQMEGFKIEKESLNVDAIIASTISIFTNSAKEKGISFQLDIAKDSTIIADKNLLEVVIRNLVSNAIKFSKEGSSIAIKTQQNAVKDLIVIEDEGIGMSQEQINEVLKGYILQSQSGTRSESGTGIGLLISKEFVEMNGGKLIIQSDINHGTMITIEFPKA